MASERWMVHSPILVLFHKLGEAHIQLGKACIHVMQAVGWMAMAHFVMSLSVVNCLGVDCGIRPGSTAGVDSDMVVEIQEKDFIRGILGPSENDREYIRLTAGHRSANSAAPHKIFINLLCQVISIGSVASDLSGACAERRKKDRTTGHMKKVERKRVGICGISGSVENGLELEFGVHEHDWNSVGEIVARYPGRLRWVRSRIPGEWRMERPWVPIMSLDLNGFNARASVRFNLSHRGAHGIKVTANRDKQQPAAILAYSSNVKLNLQRAQMARMGAAAAAEDGRGMSVGTMVTAFRHRALPCASTSLNKDAIQMSAVYAVEATLPFPAGKFSLGQRILTESCLASLVRVISIKVALPTSARRLGDVHAAHATPQLPPQTIFKLFVPSHLRVLSKLLEHAIRSSAWLRRKRTVWRGPRWDILSLAISNDLFG
ncbi:hypothetical protein K438DRAFT_2060373 [Mycena galopus ATCC 62051]|nr:hypothetical protein K438DRAFT_2060373 [Mycena galopus ATCC 62051]